jgi:hypothetical protein
MLVQERIDQLMKEEYNPEKYDNFSQGISEAFTADREIIEEMLSKPIAEMDYEKLGRKLFCMAYEYMERFATNQAMNDYENGYLRD